MKPDSRLRSVPSLLATACLTISCLLPAAGYSQALVDWLVPASSSQKPQSPEATKLAISDGRVLPTPEILQPTVDAALPAFQPRKEPLRGSLKGAASDVLPALAQAWFARFRQYHPEVKLEIAPPYAGSLGAKELIGGKIDFVFVSRELKPDDISEFKAKFGYEPLSVPISGGSYRHFGFLDAMGFFVHKDNPLEKISYEQIDALYSSTRHRGLAAITTWGQLGLTGEWADKPVNLYGIKPWNGFEEFIRQRILSTEGKRGEWREDIRFEKVVFPVAKKVAEDRYGIGYSGLAYIDAPVKMIPVGERASGPFVPPTYENVALAAYPLTRLVFFNLNRVPGKPLDPILAEFLRFVLSREGQQIVRDQGIYLPLRAQQAEAARALLR